MLGAMSAKHAILGLLIERPSYGYQLTQRLEERFGAWGWQGSGVYGALNHLERDGYVRPLKEKGAGTTGRAARRVIYEATSEGHDFLRSWVYEPTPPSPVRQALDLKIQLSPPEFLPQLIEQTRAQEQQCLDDLAALTRTTGGGPGSMRTWYEAAPLLQRDAEMRHLRVRIQWLQDARKVMQRLHSQFDDCRSR
jgi:DNA-binding PadR family transcriptional regulator